MIYRTKTTLLFIEQMDFFFPQCITGRHVKVSVTSRVRPWVATQRQWQQSTNGIMPLQRRWFLKSTSWWSGFHGKILLIASEKINVNDQAWVFRHVFQALQVDIQLWRLSTRSWIVVDHFYCKNKETINEAEHKASSKSQGNLGWFRGENRYHF